MATCNDLSATRDEYSLRCSVCPYCLDDFKVPKVLPCCHTFCKSCLEKISTSNSSEPKAQSTATNKREETKKIEEEILVTCPQCRAQHKIKGGLDALLTNFAVESERLKKTDQSSQQDDTNLCCGLCESTDPVVSYCVNCSSPLCNFCLKAHHRQKQYNGHSVKSIDEVDSKLLTSPRSQKHVGHLICSKHPTQTPQIFCNSCDELVCCECVIEGHQGHKFVGINSETRRDMEKKLTDTSLTIRNVLESFEENLEYVTNIEKVTNDTEVQAKADIKKLFDSYIATLQSRRDSLLTKAEDHYSAKLKVVWSEKDCLEKTIAKFKSALRFSEQSQKCVNDGEFLSLASQALLSLKELEGSFWDSKTVEEMNSRYLYLERKTNEPKVFRTAAKFDELKTSILKIEWKEFPAQVSLGAKYKAVLCVKRDSKSHQSFVLCNKPSVVIHHQYSPTCNVADVSIVRSTVLPGAWDVAFIPYCGGPHTCTAIVNRATTLLYSFNVAGVPPVGSRVMRGPSWNYDEIAHSYGANTADVALVTGHDILQTEKNITITWSDGKRFCYRWGNDGMFDVQIHH